MNLKQKKIKFQPNKYSSVENMVLISVGLKVRVIQEWATHAEQRPLSHVVKKPLKTSVKRLLQESNTLN